MDVAAPMQAPGKFRSFIENFREPDWLSRKRKNGLALYSELPVPPPPSREKSFPSLSPAEVEELPLTRDILKFSCGNGQVVLRSLEEALLQSEEKTRSWFGGILNPNRNKWAALNQGVWQGGVLVQVPRNLDAGVPVLIRHDLPESSASVFPRVLVVAEEGCRVVILDQYQSRSSKVAFVAPVIEVIAGENSNVHYAQIQEWGNQTHHLSSAKIVTRRNANVTATSCMFGGRRTVNHLSVSLQGEGSQANLFGLVFGDDEQVFEHYTLQEHLARRTRSDLLIKVALQGKAYSHFDGLIWIEKGAAKTSAYQQNRNLLLSPHAKADSNPRLEILDNDILGCTHGAAVGPVDEEQIFYLESRGIEREEAEALVVEGFFEQVLSRITVESLRTRLAAELSNRLRRNHGELA